MLRLRYLSSQVTVSQRPWPPPGRFATSNSASWLLDCEAWRKPFFPRLLALLSVTPLELSFADSTAWGHNSAPDRGRALNPHTPPTPFSFFSNLNISFSLANVHFSVQVKHSEKRGLTFHLDFAFFRNKDKNSTRRHCYAQLRPPCTLLTHLDVSLTNDCDKVLQQGAPTSKSLPRWLSCLRAGGRALLCHLKKVRWPTSTGFMSGDGECERMIPFTLSISLTLEEISRVTASASYSQFISPGKKAWHTRERERERERERRLNYYYGF